MYVLMSQAVSLFACSWLNEYANENSYLTRVCVSLFTYTCISINSPSLVSGDVLGNFKLLFSRVQNVLKKTGPFEVCTIYSPRLASQSHFCKKGKDVINSVYNLCPTG